MTAALAKPCGTLPARVARAESSVLLMRVALVVVTWVYGYVLHYSHVHYLNVIWDYFGFVYYAPGLSEVATMVLLLTSVALVLPLRLGRPSAMILMLLFEVVFVPALVMSLALRPDSLSRYGAGLAMMAAGLIVASFVARLRIDDEPAGHLPGDGFGRVLVVAWVACAALLVITFGSIMSLATLEDVYLQRAAGASTSALVSYVQTYFSGVLCPALIAVGLVRGKWSFFVLGTIGCVLMYSIDAQRTVFLYPVIMGLQYLLLRSRRALLRTALPSLLMISALIYYCTLYHEDNLLAGALSVYLVFRTFSIPGLSFSQYSDVFELNGYTWWSHIKGIDLFVSAPTAFANDAAWPQLGRVIGVQVYNNAENNVNANLFSGDGVAAAGALGVLVIGLVLALYLWLLDRAAKGWDKRFVTLVILPVALGLTNGHLFTILLSFGGLFWLLVFHFYKPGAPRPAPNFPTTTHKIDEMHV